MEHWWQEPWQPVQPGHRFMFGPFTNGDPSRDRVNLYNFMCLLAFLWGVNERERERERKRVEEIDR